MNDHIPDGAHFLWCFVSESVSTEQRPAEFRTPLYVVLATPLHNSLHCRFSLSKNENGALFGCNSRFKLAINNLIVPGGYFVPSPFLVLKIYLCSYLQTLAASWLFNKLVGTGSMLSIFLWFVHPISKILHCPFSTGCSVYQHHTFHSFIDFVLSGSKTELLTRLHKGLSLSCPLKTKVRYSSKATWYPHACTAWNFSCEDYIMCSIFEWVPVTFVLASGKLLGVYTRTRSTHFWINFLILIVYTQWTYEYCLCMFQSILKFIVLLKNCSRAVACGISFPIVWCAIVLCGEWIL